MSELPSMDHPNTRLIECNDRQTDSPRTRQRRNQFIYKSCQSTNERPAELVRTLWFLIIIIPFSAQPVTDHDFHLDPRSLTTELPYVQAGKVSPNPFIAHLSNEVTSLTVRATYGGLGTGRA